MFNPQFIFSLLWLSQIVLNIIFNTAFTPFEVSTWFAIAICIIAFNMGSLCLIGSGRKKGYAEFDNKLIPLNIFKFLNLFFVIYFFAALFSCIAIYRALMILSPGGLTPPIVRQLVVQDFTTVRDLYALFEVFNIGVGFSIFFISFSRFLTKKQLYLILAIGLISAIATTGRLYILLFFCATSILLHRNKIISLRTVFVGALIFILLFFLIAIVLVKGDDSGSIADRVLWNSQVYFMSSVACFNDFVATGAQRIDGGALLPNPLREVLSSIGVLIPPKPTLNPFAEVPVPCNTYTILFPLFHDASFLGVFIGSFLIGVLHKNLYLKFLSSNNSILWYLYAISVYPLVMSIFEDAYFSSPGFWLLLWIPPITYGIFSRVYWRNKEISSLKT
ncbi:O-antigen polymerase [Glaciimonas immobilis]|uniref:Oligosaccharide repeat unit polymerase n=1 Tax=Glaciimonas immobilis TaxID=728004 RepID=A0A840RTA6_9BURK|nr:O-antigen polymerase [Glaciimonas immobilis]KAF3997446.1 oligosaccharide repeat unit polymerase [Glaciimonas immobilis]MBB5200883.1 oligosaccharide repeat unit polymerase [Glaciimonas immobilis]